MGGVVAACRAFLWGTKSGAKQLPAFPEPSHVATWQGNQVPVSGRQNVVGFTSEEAREKAHKMVSALSTQSLSGVP